MFKAMLRIVLVFHAMFLQLILFLKFTDILSILRGEITIFGQVFLSIFIQKLILEKGHAM